jgi:hypothetical protein
MTVTAKALQPGLALGTGDTTLYTAPTSTTAYVQSATIVNTDSVARTFNIRRVGVGAAPDVYLIKGVSLAAGKNYVAPELVNLVLGAGDYLVGTASSGAVVTVVISGAEIVG